MVYHSKEVSIGFNFQVEGNLDLASNQAGKKQTSKQCQSIATRD